MRRKFWTTFFIALICFSALFIMGGHYLSNKNSMASTEEDGSLEEGDEANIDQDNNEMIFLLMGIDDEYNKGGVEDLKKKRDKSRDKYITTGYRSDTMILCKFNFDTGEISMLSIPRDTKTDIRGRKNQERINHAHSYGGAYLAMDAVKDLLGVDLKYYVTVDYLAVKEIVNAIGGVDIDVPRNMNYKDVLAKPPLIINVRKGQQTLNGDKSLEYLRFRSYPEGDVGRVEAQKLFMKEFITQVAQPRNILRLPKIIKTYFDYVDTNIPMDLVLKGVGSAKKIDMENIKTATIPGEGKYIGDISYYIYYENEMRALVDEMFEGFLLRK